MRILALISTLALTGCSSGAFVPEAQEFYEPKAFEKADENVIVNQVKCEIHLGVQNALDDFGDSVAWLKTYVAKVTFKLTMDEKGTLSPGVSYIKPFSSAVLTFAGAPSVSVSRMFSLGGGVSGSSEAQRIETLGFTYKVSDLLKEGRLTPPCSNETGILIHSDLKIPDFIVNKAYIARVPGSVSEAIASPRGLGQNPFNAFNYEVSFDVIYSGNITPSWKFTFVTANPSSPLFSSSRSRTHDVTITMGPSAGSSNGTPLLSSDGQGIHEAALIGQAVAAALKQTTPP